MISTSSILRGFTIALLSSCSVVALQCPAVAARFPASVMGPQVVPSTTSAKGLWTLQEQMQAQKDGNWPSLINITYTGSPTITTDGSDTIFKFTSSGSITFSRNTTADYLAAAAGGGGGRGTTGGYFGGAGGAGELLNETAQTLNGLYNITIGAKGVKGASINTEGTDGGDTVFGALTLKGGGGGGKATSGAGATGGRDGGSGGGAGGSGPGSTNPNLGGSSTPSASGLGNDGGNSGAPDAGTAGLGGGSAGAGAAAQPNGTAATNGTASLITGSSVDYAVGGGIFRAGSAPAANTGSGGHGSDETTPTDGSDGVVIIRVATADL